MSVEEMTMPNTTMIEQAVLQHLQEVLGSEASIQRTLSRSRKTGRCSPKLASAVSELHRQADQVEQLLRMLEQMQ